jgi:hypothetical protein
MQKGSNSAEQHELVFTTRFADESSKKGGPKNSQKKNNKNGKNQNGQKKSTEHITCFRCNKKGHYASDCPDGGGPKEKAVRKLDHIKCYNCGKNGHFAMDCPADSNKNDDDSGEEGLAAFARFGEENVITCATRFEEIDLEEENSTIIAGMIEKEIIDEDIAFDTVANGSLFHNVKFLTNVHEASTKVTIQGITGKMSTRLVGDFPGLLNGIRVNIAASLNILCAADVEDRHKVHYTQGVEYVVVAEDGRIYHFVRRNKLYICRYSVDADLTEYSIKIDVIAFTDMTVEERESKFSTREVLAARRARDAQMTLGLPSARELAKPPEYIEDMPFVARDVERAEKFTDLYTNQAREN